MVRFIIRIRSIIIYIILLRWIICTLKGNSITIIILGHMILIFHFNHITGYTGYTSVDHIALVFGCVGVGVFTICHCGGAEEGLKVVMIWGGRGEGRSMFTICHCGGAEEGLKVVMI